MANAMHRVALAFQGVHHIHGRHSLAIGMLSVLKTIAYHSVQKVIQRRARLVVDVTRNPLHAAATSQVPAGRLADDCLCELGFLVGALDVVVAVSHHLLHLVGVKNLLLPNLLVCF